MVSNGFYDGLMVSDAFFSDGLMVSNGFYDGLMVSDGYFF